MNDLAVSFSRNFSNTPFRTLVLLSTLLVSSLAQAGVWRVDDDSSAAAPNGARWETAYPDIQSAIDAAVAAGASASDPAEIWVAAGTYTGLGEAVVLMADYVSLFGGFAGTESARAARDWTLHESVIDGQASRRCVTGANEATLDGFTITRGQAAEGAGMHTLEAAPTISHCAFHENISTSNGGGLYTAHAATVVSQCTFSSNRAESSGGGICNYAADAVFSACVFTENHAESSGAGLYNTHASPTISACLFTRNTAGFKGGGLYNLSSHPHMVNCIFSANTARRVGGGVCNTTSSPTLWHCLFTGNAAKDNGGALGNTDSCYVVVKNCILWENMGGEIYTEGAVVVITYSCVSGGYEGAGNTAANPLFWQPQADDYRLHLTSPCLNSGTIAEAPATDMRGLNRPQGAGIDMGPYEMAEADTDGDGLADEFESLYAGTQPDSADSNSNGLPDGEEWFSFQVWHVDAAASAIDADGYSWETAFPDLQTAVNTASLHGGGEIWVAQGNYTSASDPVLRLQDNVHVYGGFEGDEIVLTERNWQNHVTVIDGEGERRCVIGAYNATLDGFNVLDGVALDGAGLYNYAAEPLVANCIFSDHTAEEDGGAVYNRDCSPSFSNCDFLWNAALDGAGMLNYRANPILSECVFSENNAAHAGGGLANWYADPVLSECIFMYNTADSWRGGGLYNTSSDPVLEACEFTENTADYGGGVYNESSDLSLDGCAFSDNHATTEGGGLSNNYNDDLIQITDCTFSGNSTDGNGGGIHSMRTEVILRNCRFSGNEAVNGGAIYHDVDPLEIYNGIFVSNSASGNEGEGGNGGAIFLGNIDLTVVNATFYANQAKAGGGFYNRGSRTAVLGNCIFWENAGASICSENATPAVTYSCIDGGHAGEGNIDANPLFWQALAGDLRLHYASPCIDSGAAALAPETDIRGLSRPAGAGVDMGAYEMHAPDTDSDGLADDFETTYGGTLPGEADSDGDGVDDGAAWFGGGIWYADAASTAAEPDGGSWEQAFPDLQRAVDTAYLHGGTEVWVAQGSYTGGDDEVLMLRSHVAIYGGFAGTESDREERDWANSISSIDGEGQRRCVFGAETAVLDGFTITHGYADFGAGILMNATSPTLRNCRFSNNSANQNGGGICALASAPILSAIHFLGNTAGDAGGGLYSSSAAPVLSNGLFYDNTASEGAGIYAAASELTILNCTLAGNTAAAGSALSCYEALATTLSNCILWGNYGNQLASSPSDAAPVITGSCVEGGYAGDGNIDANPLFWQALGGDFRIHLASPCLDGGTAADAPESDIRALARPQGAGVDMGAYEMNPLDSDGDGLLDDFESTYSGTSPSEPDSDGDGQSDGAEWFQSDPWYVDATVSTPGGDGRSWAAAFSVIQAAVDTAFVHGGGEVWVAQGLYTGAGEHVLILRNSVAIYGGFAGTESEREERYENSGASVISGESSRRCVLGANGARLDGFTLTAGSAPEGAGLYNAFASPVIFNCIFHANTAAQSGGACFNFEATPTLVNCVLYENAASEHGGAVYNEQSAPVLTNCTIVNNAAEAGGGLYNSQSIPVISNSVLWGNLWGQLSDSPDTQQATVRYSCIEGAYAGLNNIDSDPVFWQPFTGDFRLHFASQCLDGGETATAPDRDIRGVERPQRFGVDIGAYEMRGIDSDGDGLMDEFESTYAGTLPDVEDSDGDGVLDDAEWFSEERWYVDLNTTAAPPDGRSWESAFSEIQAAIDTAYTHGGGTIWVARGVYQGSGAQVVQLRQNVHLYGGFEGVEAELEARDWERFEAVIDGQEERRCVIGADNATLNGFRIINGAATSGAGVYNYLAEPRLMNCSFSDNTALYGSCIYNEKASPEIDGCLFFQNATENYGVGAGIYNDQGSPRIIRCTFSHLSAFKGGGIANYRSSATIESCFFEKNYTPASGGGLYNEDSLPEIINCVFCGNTSDDRGGAIYNTRSAATYANCSITDNYALNHGDGIFNEASPIVVFNCIIWGNAEQAMYDLDSSPTVNYTCIDREYAGERNINADPMFFDGVDEEDGYDLRLRFGSPCKNTASEEGAPATDILGVERPHFNYVDMGAYESTLIAYQVHTSTDGNSDPLVVVVEPSQGAYLSEGQFYKGTTIRVTLKEVAASEIFCYWLVNGVQYSTAYSIEVTVDAPLDITAVFIPEFHDGDYQAPFGEIDLSELLRFIQFFNSDGYHCAEQGDMTNEGYTPGPGNTSICQQHSGDFSPATPWVIDMTELLRFVQFYNIGGYYRCQDPLSDEGYCPGSNPQ